MNKFRRVWNWICYLLNEISTYKVEGEIRGMIYLYHSGPIVNVQVTYDWNQLEKQHHSITANSTSSNFAQPSGQDNLVS